MSHRLRLLALAAVLALSPIVYAQDAAPSTAPAMAQSDPAPAAQMSADATPASGKFGAPAAGKGQIIFFRPKKFMGAAISYKVREGETELGKLSSGTYVVTQVDPGAHEYTVHSEAKDVLHMEVEAGETYYVIATITMGVLAGRPNLAPSDQAMFDSMSAKLKPAK
ncbi:MAG: DUF2846 domain-containing protein [Luteimonas sp.]